ncbi:hypothetical protein EYC80_000889 [Monilinia laxa]|uniref:BTB domain-containing protein n=1 Tax=Monilinia laxa TaxID=61186 RepID=A0A5N6K7M2_MONLA|nr:hypothetical protein EYC80_000889 [Monilinia laxa]
MLRGGFSEATAKFVDLPEDDFSAFELLVEWCYTNRVSMPNEKTSYDDVEIRVNLYCLARKYCALTLQDFVTNYIITWLKMSGHHAKNINPKWITTIETELSGTHDELGGIDGVPGPLRFLIGSAYKVMLLASKSKPSKLATVRLANFRSQQLDWYGGVYSGLPSRDFSELLKESEWTIAEKLTPSSTSCCEYHTHSMEKLLECPVFKEIKGTAKHSPDAHLIVAYLKRYPEKRVQNGIAKICQFVLRREFNSDAKIVSIKQVMNGIKELCLMGVFSKIDGTLSSYEFHKGMSVQLL